MNEDDLKSLKNLSTQLRRLSDKVKLVGLLERAKTAYDKSNFKDCEAECKKALELDSNNSTALRGLGCVRQAEGNYDEAIKYYKKASEYSMNKEIEFTLIGTAYYFQDKYEEAILYYNKAININDDYEKAYEGRNQAILENHLQIVDMQESLIKAWNKNNSNI